MRDCDIVMKGGVTSGVVYPGAITTLAKEYRFRSIGGASAGAIGAVMAAAAEYRRQEGDGTEWAGFDRIGSIPDDLGRDMLRLFQPSPALRPVFDLAIGFATGGFAKAALRVYRIPILVAVLILAGTLWWGWSSGNGWIALSGFLACIVLTVVWVVVHLYRQVFRELPRHDFGLCPGISTDGNPEKGFGDWIADEIDAVAGRGPEDDPLTVGDLARHDIEIAAMTTDLSSARPYQLPLKTRIHYFSKAEFERLFAPRLVEYLCRAGEHHVSPTPGAPKDLYRLPSGEDFPVFLVARMSLSFPALIQAVPLWRYDAQLRDADDRAILKRCLFSDGGISSNFPIHFFDALAPSRPTFGIALGSWEAARHGDGRFLEPKVSRQSTDLPVREIGTVTGFAMAILNTAKDWQDTMQTMLPGYADRIVTVLLDDAKEGGLNLDMDEGTVKTLSGYGTGAARLLLDGFDFTQHTYNRALSAFPPLESSLMHVGKVYGTARYERADGDPFTYAEVMTDFETKNYAKNSKTWRTESLGAFAADLAAIGQKASAKADEKTAVNDGRVLPRSDRVIRLVAIADRMPERDAAGAGDAQAGDPIA